MRILLLSASDLQGGAGRASYRLHNSLLEANVDSHMLVQRKKSSDNKVIGPSSRINQIISTLRSYIDGLPLKIYRRKTKTMFSILWLPFSSIPNKINKINPDIVHIHWVGSGMVSLEDFTKINAPIVLSLHDMWAFTGGCHYDENCNGYESGCGNCKVLGSQKEYDLSKKIFQTKEKIFSQISNLTLVGLSRWIEKSSKESIIFKNKRFVNIPNPIDINIFKPFNQNSSRDLWSLPKNKKLILFGAMSATSDLRKGFLELSGAVKDLKGKDIELVVFGSNKPLNNINLNLKIHYLGNIDNDEGLAKLYSAADVMIVPSLQENLSNSIMESLSCGTPVVGFNIGGNSDMIEHKKNGYLSAPFKPDSLKSGIEWVLNSPNYNQLCKNARNKVIHEFDSKVVAKKYIKLYEEILK
jgi:glycosyltransferase involved in cell wall biosynthesis